MLVFRKNKIMLIPLIITSLTVVSLEAEISVSVSGNDKVSVITDDDRGNREYIYVDKNSRIINSTIGTKVYVNGDPMSKEESIKFHQRKIDRYRKRIEEYNTKIERYRNKIANKPKHRTRYERKIGRYQEKIKKYEKKIRNSETKIRSLSNSKN